MGGNQGQVHRHFDETILHIDRNLGKVYARSRIYSTKAWGPVAQPDFLNMAIALHTSFPAHYLLKELLSLEKKFGRRRDIKYGPRTLDIDILFYGERVISGEGLIVPHPEMQNRRFALVPCCEIVPNLVHPVFKKDIRTLLEECSDTLEVDLWKA